MKNTGEGANKMVLEQTDNNVWLNEKQKIASFHLVRGYRKYTCAQRERFIDFLKDLESKGYKFQ